ncbi:MAG: MFS transporter [Dehalococcoidia bacterium]|nr:MFS transporter [Dehalococcoidia bacterium]
MATSVRGWTVLLLNRLHYSTVVLSSFGFGLFLPFIQEDLGLSYLQIGALQAVSWGASVALLVPFSVLFARFNPNRRVLVGLALLTPFLFTQGVALGFWTLMVSRFLMVLTQAGMTPARPLLLRWWAAPRQYATVTSVGLSLHSTFMAAALTFSPLIIVLLDSWRLAYFLQAALMGLHLLVWTVLTRGAEPVFDESRTTGPDDSGAGEGDAPAEDSASSPLIRALVAYPHAWLLGLVMLCLSASWTTVLTFLPTILEEQRGIAISAGSMLFGFMYYVLIPGGLLGSRIFQHITDRRLMVLLPAAMNTLFTVIALLAGNQLLVAVALTGVGLVWVFVPAMEILPFEFRGIRAREVSVLAGLVQTFSAIGFGGGPLLAGALAQASGSPVTGVLVVGGLTGLAILAAAMLPRSFGGSRYDVIG